jgi:hypothetical protein
MTTEYRWSLLGLLALAACGETPDGAASAMQPHFERSTDTRRLPPVVGPEPTQKAVIFYYPWYGNPQTDGRWVHWDEPGFQPPSDITSRYWPAVGVYSSNDAWTIAQHCAWLRRAGVGVLALSWWGRESFEERAAAGILDMAERYRLKVAFHIEPYGGRTAGKLVEDVAYLNQRYGSHPALFRSHLTSRHNPNYSQKGVFFMWSPVITYDGGEEVPPEYWRPALDAIHAANPSSLVIGHQTDARWVDGAHFDGLYNYGSLAHQVDGTFDWAKSLPPGAWYVPSVLPGAMFWNDTAPWPDLPRRNGATYAEQWRESLGTGVQPQLVSITSFNEWHEGTQIEPVEIDAVNSSGVSYMTYWPLAPDSYLDRTANEVGSFVNTSWPQIFPGRIRLRTSSDWTTLRITSGAAWLRPETLSVSPSALMARLENDVLYLVQPIADAEAGQSVQVTIDLAYSGISYKSEAPVTFAVERGHLGSTNVTLWNATWGSPIVQIADFTWGGIAPGPNNVAYYPIPVRAFLP